MATKARKPSAATVRKQAAVEAFTRDLGAAPPKSWSTAHVEGLHGKLTSFYGKDAPTVYGASLKGASKEMRAAAAKAVDDSVAKAVAESKARHAAAYAAKFGHQPPQGMSVDAMKRWTEGPMKAAPGRTGDPAYEQSVKDASAANVRAKAAAAAPARAKPAAPSAKPAAVTPSPASSPAPSGGWRMQPGREPGAEASRNQRLWKGYKSDAVRDAVRKAPYDAWRSWLDNRFNDRPAAAKALRDYRTSLGRAAPSTLSSAVAKGKTGEFVASQTGKAIQRFNPYRESRMPDTTRGELLRGIGTLGFGIWATTKVTQGYAFGGMKGAARETVDAATFGLGGRAFDKVFGDKPDWEGAARSLQMQSPGQTAAGRRAEMINKRPTKAARNWLDKQEGRTVQKDVADPNDLHNVRQAAHDLTGFGVGIAGGVAATAATAKLGQGVMAAGKALVKAAPMLSGVGKLASRAVPALALGLGAYAVGSRAIEGYRQGGVSGAVKGAGAGALSFATFGASDALMSSYQQANAGYQGRQAAASASAPGNGGVTDGGRGWANPKVQAAAQKARGHKYDGPGA